VAAREVEIVNRQGLHARPAMTFAETASRFRSRVTVYKDNKKVDGKSVMEMMLLDAERGAVLRIETEGEDAQPCLDALADLVQEGFKREDLPR
jgi:phosphocarrier protein